MEIVKSQLVNDIEFYVSQDGSQTGVSITGLARLCGLSGNKALSNPAKGNCIIDKLTCSEPGNNLPSESLECIRGKVFSQGITSPNGAKIVTAEAAEAIIGYYAFERKNKIAQDNYRAFARIGIDSWIKKAIGFSIEEKQDCLLDMMSRVLNKVELQSAKIDELSVKVESLDNFQKVTVTLPGLRHQFEAYSKLDNALDSEPFDIDTWLKERGYILNHAEKCSFGRILADVYKTNRHENPPKLLNSKLGKRKTGYSTVYRASDIPMIEAVFHEYLKKHGMDEDSLAS